MNGTETELGPGRFPGTSGVGAARGTLVLAIKMAIIGLTRPSEMIVTASQVSISPSQLP